MQIKDLTQEEFNNCPIGQKFVESCGSARRFYKAVKTSKTEIEILVISNYNFNAYCEIRVFDPDFTWIEPVDSFIDIHDNEYSFEELKEHFLPKETVS